MCADYTCTCEKLLSPASEVDDGEHNIPLIYYRVYSTTPSSAFLGVLMDSLRANSFSEAVATGALRTLTTVQATYGEYVQVGIVSSYLYEAGFTPDEINTVVSISYYITLMPM